MIRAFIRNRLSSEERSLGVSLDYLRDILDTSLRSFVKFALFMPLAQNRRALPVAPYFVARIVAARDEDCGTCVQVEVNLAKKAGVPIDDLRAVIVQTPEKLSEPLADVYHFTEAVVGASGDVERYQGRITRHYGKAALTELALAIAAARFFPITKRALGHARSCSQVSIEL